MDYIKKLERLCEEEEKSYIRNYINLGCVAHSDIAKMVQYTKLNQLKSLLEHFKGQKEEWFCCKDKLPPKRTLVMMKHTSDDRYPIYRKRSLFGLNWLNKGGKYQDEIRPTDYWRSI